jgi:hypothetical protein
VDDRAVAATRDRPLAGRAIILVSADMILNERKDDDEEAQTSKAIFGAGG